MAQKRNIFLVPAYGARTQDHREQLGAPIGPYHYSETEAIARGIDTLHEMYAGFGYILRVEGTYFPDVAADEAEEYVDRDWYRWALAHDIHERVDATQVNVAQVVAPGIFRITVHSPKGAVL